MQYNENLAEYIKQLRISKKQSLNSFAYKNSIEPSTLSRIENKKLEIKMSILRNIAGAYKKTPAEFLTDFEKQNL